MGKTSKTKAPLEKHVQNAILNFLSLHRVFVWPNKTQGTFDPKKKVFRRPTSRHWINGVADILGVTPKGRIIAIEVKRPGERPSDAQKEFLFDVSNRGGVAFVATSIEDVEQKLNELKET
jgi:hypothetical protein